MTNSVCCENAQGRNQNNVSVRCSRIADMMRSGMDGAFWCTQSSDCHAKSTPDAYTTVNSELLRALVPYGKVVNIKCRTTVDHPTIQNGHRVIRI